MIMKNIFLFSILALLGMSQSVAKDYEYVPFVREGVKWVYCINNYNEIYPINPDLPVGRSYYTLELKGDTVINDKTYKAMHKYSGDHINNATDTIPIYLREENKIVYGIIPDGVMYFDCPVDVHSEVDPYSGEEFIVYNFNNVTEYLNERLNVYYEPVSVNLLSIGDHVVNRYLGLLCGFLEFDYIEGIGMDSETYGYTLCFFMGTLTSNTLATYTLNHVIENGEIIYKGRHFRAEGVHTGIDEVTAEQHRVADGNYYDLMGRPVGKDVPSTPGIYIHNGQKIVVR